MSGFPPAYKTIQHLVQRAHTRPTHLSANNPRNRIRPRLGVEAIVDILRRDEAPVRNLAGILVHAQNVHGLVQCLALAEDLL